MDSSDGTVVVAAMDNSYVRMVKIDINGNTISDPITNRYNSDLSAISSKADLIERWTNGTSQPSSGYYIFEKSSNFDSISMNILYSHEILGNLIPDATFSDGDNGEILLLDSVSYTHLTLPTILLV